MASKAAINRARKLGAPDNRGKQEAQFETSSVSLLALLHDEAVENARHARLLEQTPAAASSLIALCLVVAALHAGSAIHVAFWVWIFFVLTAAIVMLRLAKMAEVFGPGPLPLRGFALDLDAALLFAGFSWGAGAFLALPANAGNTALVLFGLSAASLVTGILKSQAAAIYFLMPALALTGIAGLTGLGGAAPASLLALAGLALVLGAGWGESRTARLYPESLLTVS